MAERDRLLSDCRALNSTESSNLSLPARSLNDLEIGFANFFVFNMLWICPYRAGCNPTRGHKIRETATPLYKKTANAIFLS